MSSKQWCAGVVLALAGAMSADAASYLVLGRSGSDAQTLQARIESIPGGKLQRALPGLLVFAVQSDDAAYPARLRVLPGVQYVAPDRTFTLDQPRQQPLARDAAEAAAQMQRALAAGAPRTVAGAVDQGLLAGNPLYRLQWAVRDVQAPQAWTRGYAGAGVRVAILDSGIDCSNPWLAPNIDFAAAASLVPGEGVCVQPGFYFNHGTHVAGIVAALPSSFGTVGIAPAATLLPVKVLSEYNGSGAFSWVLAGVVYAADQGADVVNMSLGAYPMPTSDPDTQAYLLAFGRAADYARARGAAVIVAAGNDAAQLGAGGNVGVPANAPGMITVSASGPAGWATGNPDYAWLDYLADYTDYGPPIANAGPGGTFWYADVDPDQSCNVAGFSFACYVFDGVMSTIPGGWSFAWGTSMATPAASAVAALAIERGRISSGAYLTPQGLAQFRARQADFVRSALQTASVDRGPRGRDPYFGYGRVDAGNVSDVYYRPPRNAPASTPLYPPYAQ